MKKKIIFVTFCLILFLIFTTLSYGLDPRQIRLRGHPWEHMKSPSQDGTVIPYDKVTNGNIINLLVIRIGMNNFILMKNGNNTSLAPAGCYHPAEKQADDNIRLGAEKGVHP